MRRYQLQPNPCYGWYTGRSEEGLQVLMGLDWNAMVCMLFSAEGEYVRFVDVYFSRSGELQDVAHSEEPFELDDGADDKLEAALENWVDAVVVSEEPICVLAFEHPERSIAISELPSDLQDFVEDSASVSRELRPRYAEKLRAWRERGDFVFWWNEDYYCNSDGEVHSH